VTADGEEERAMNLRRVLIKGGTVISVDPEIGDLPKGDVLFEGGKIAEVAPDVKAPDAEVIDATDKIVMPGMVDAHRHVWQGAIKGVAPDTDLNDYFMGVLAAFAPTYEPEDVYAGELIGALEALDAGVTTLVDWSHIQNTPEHTDEAIRALRQAGGRAVFAYGFANTGPEWFYESTLDHPSDARRVRSEHFSSDDGLVTMAMALRGPELSSMEVTERDWALARELGLRVTVHVGNGAFGVPYRAIEKLNEAKLMDPGTQYVHNTSLTDEALGLVRESGGTAVVTPAVEMQMGFGVPATGRLLRAGLRPGLGIDVVTSTGSDLFTQMRAALQAQRVLALTGDEGTPAATIRDVLGFATIEGARSIGVDAQTGSLTPGKEADVVLLRADALGLTPLNNPVGAVVLAAHPGLVDSVFVAGRVLKRDGALVGVDAERVRRLATESRDRLFEKAGVRVGTG